MNFENALKKASIDAARQKESEYALFVLEGICKTYSIARDVLYKKMKAGIHMETYMISDYMVEVVKFAIKSGLPDKETNLFLAAYMQRRNNTGAVPSYNLPSDHTPDIRVKSYPLDTGVSKEQIDAFLDGYNEVPFSEEDYKIFGDGMYLLQDRKYSVAYNAFDKLIDKHPNFVKLVYNRIMCGFQIYTVEKFNDLYGYVNGYKKTKKSLKKISIDALIESIEHLDALYVSFQILKKKFPKYDMFKKNRGLLASINRLIIGLEDEIDSRVK